MDKLIYIDGKFFDPNTTTYDQYFLRKDVLMNNLQNNFQNNKMTNKGQVNSSRPFNENNANDQHTFDAGSLHLRDNRHPNNNINPYETAIVYNNFMNGNNSMSNSPGRKPVARNHNHLDLYHNPITLRDYESLSASHALQYDQRGFCSYLGDEIIKHHFFFSMFSKYSILDSPTARVVKFLFMCNMIMGLNASCYTDDYIDQLATRQKVNLLII
jgi:hypothetical protein